MIFVVKFDTESAAFDDDPGPEIARILRQIAGRCAAGDVPEFYQTIVDVNGNDIGQWAHKHPSRL